MPSKLQPNNSVAPNGVHMCVCVLYAACASMFIKDVMPTSAFNPNPQGSHPQGLTVDAAGSLYWAEYDNNCIKKYEVGALASTEFAGTCSGNPGKLLHPVTGQGWGHSRTYMLFRSHSCRSVCLCLTCVWCFGGAGGLNKPADVAFDAQGNLYIADSRK